MKRTFLLPLVAFVIMLMCNVQTVRAEEDPYLLWQTTDPLGYSGFVIHPNGNIIANRNCEFFEIDGNTGKVIRAFPVHYGYQEAYSITISSDGKYFAAIYWGSDSGTTFIFEYQSGEVFRKFKRLSDNIRFIPNSKNLLLTTFLQGTEDKSLQLYNIDDENFVWYGPGFKSEGFECISISDDGKYFATGGRKIENSGIEEKTYVYLRLWDTQTMEPIKELAKIEGSNEVRSIKFSPDGNQVGFFISLVDIIVYNLDNYSIAKSYSGGNFVFIKNNLIAFYSSNIPIAPPDIMIRTIEDDKLIFSKRTKNGGTNIETNQQNNTLLYLDKGQIYSLKLNKILTSVPYQEKSNEIIVEYKNKALLVKGLKNLTGQYSFIIDDINGREIRRFSSIVTNSHIAYPLNLPNGTYLIHIQDGSKEYSSKFIVLE